MQHSRISPFLNRLLNFPQRVFFRKMSSSKKTATLIFLHGLGDNGGSWKGQLEQILPSYIKTICPTAEQQPVTINFGLRCNSWFDIRSLDASGGEDKEGIEAACSKIHKMINDEENKGTPHNRIMLGGFSQGGALSLYSALKYEKTLAGVIALSCWLPLNKEFPASTSQANKNLPILQCHGDSDHVVSVEWGKQSNEVLKRCVSGLAPEIKIYPNLDHGACGQEMSDVVNFVKKHIKST